MTTKWGGAPRGTPPQLPPHAGQPARPTRQTTGHMQVNLVYPIALSIAIGAMLSVGVAGWSALNGVDLDVAMTRAGRVFLIVFPGLGTLTLLVLFAIYVWFPIFLARIEHPGHSPRPRDRLRTITVNRPRQRRTENKRRQRIGTRAQGSKPFQGAFRGAGQLIAKAGDRLAAAPPPRKRAPAKRGSFAQEARPVQATFDHTRPEYEGYVNLYKGTHAMYDQDLRRDEGAWRVVFPTDNWQLLYAQFKEAWVKRGWVELDGRNTIVGWAMPEHELYASDPVLKRVATQMGFKWPDDARKGHTQ